MCLIATRSQLDGESARLKDHLETTKKQTKTVRPLTPVAVSTPLLDELTALEKGEA